MKPREILEHDDADIFIDTLRDLCDSYRTDDDVSFYELREFIPLWDHRWDADFKFTGKNCKEMAENFFHEFADHLFDCVLEQRKDKQDEWDTENYNARLRY